MHKYTLIIFILSRLYAASPSPVFGENGMVVSSNINASKVGISILKKGGNAIDAAVAVGFALAVTDPGNTGLGGGGFMVSVTSDGEIFTQDHREKAPSSSKENMFLDENNNVIEGKSLYTMSSSGVPGTVDGLINAWSDYGSGEVGLHQLLTPAIKLAEKGYKLSYAQANG